MVNKKLLVGINGKEHEEEYQLNTWYVDVYNGDITNTNNYIGRLELNDAINTAQKVIKLGGTYNLDESSISKNIKN